MVQWEYLRVNTPDFDLLGQNGWEWLALQNGEHIFKRPAPTASERFTREQSERIRRPDAQNTSRENAAIPRVLNPELAALVRRVGHTQMLLICDRGFPAPLHLPLKTVDLSITSDLPTIIQVLDVILPELPHDRIIMASEMRQHSTERFEWHQRQPASVEVYPHEVFKRLSNEAIGCIRTGDATPYANVIVVGG